jgi:hypothetical protein
VRDIRVHEHAEEPECDDIGDRVSHLALVCFNCRCGGNDGGDATDARASSDERAESWRQPEATVEPRDEKDSGRNRRQHHRESGKPELRHVEGT